MRFILILCAAIAGARSIAAGQQTSIPAWPIATGSRVRIVSPVLGNEQKNGWVVTTTPDSLVFLPAKDSARVSISTTRIISIDVLHGTHTEKKNDTVIGMLIGATGGAILGYATYKRPKPCDIICFDPGRGGQAAIGGALGGILGSFIGFVVGSRPIDTWVPVALPHQ
jgi:hypothetical protein